VPAVGSTTEIAGTVIVGAPNAVRPATIFDLSGVPSAVVDVVVSVLCRMIFDFSLWSAEAKAAPLLLV
jgi:hypothetical protein